MVLKRMLIFNMWDMYVWGVVGGAGGTCTMWEVRWRCSVSIVLYLKLTVCAKLADQGPLRSHLSPAPSYIRVHLSPAPNVRVTGNPHLSPAPSVTVTGMPTYVQPLMWRLQACPPHVSFCVGAGILTPFFMFVEQVLLPTEPSPNPWN